MSRSARFDLSELILQFPDAPSRFNDWYFTAHFVHEGHDYLAKFSISEGNLLGQAAHLTFSQDPLLLEQEPDALVLRPAPTDVNIAQQNLPLEYAATADEARVTMGDLTAICRPDQQRIISRHAELAADLTFTPRGPILTWDHGANAASHVTEISRVYGREALSDVRGEVTVRGRRFPVVGRGLFEHVWFNALNFFQIRCMDWFYANFDELYLYICHCESVTAESRPFHFETGEIVLPAENELLIARSIEVTPESWVFMQQARRFIPLEQTIVVRTDRGRLRFTSRLLNHPLMAQDPTRLESLCIDNIPGWSSLFYDGPVALEGKFTFEDGRVLQLTNGRGINEQIRISAL